MDHPDYHFQSRQYPPQDGNFRPTNNRNYQHAPHNGFNQRDNRGRWRDRPDRRENPLGNPRDQQHQHQRRNFHHHGKRDHSQNSGDISRYYKPSFLQDPWNPPSRFNPAFSSPNYTASPPISSTQHHQSIDTMSYTSYNPVPARFDDSQDSNPKSRQISDITNNIASASFKTTDSNTNPTNTIDSTSTININTAPRAMSSFLSSLPPPKSKAEQQSTSSRTPSINAGEADPPKKPSVASFLSSLPPPKSSGQSDHDSDFGF